jgi:Ni/Fe-hydrogenase subunit HybB-like protein
MNAHAEPAGGPFITRTTLTLAALSGLAALLILWRLLAGLGATTALSDGYPWGLWIAFDVVTGTALACGGYAMALLVYIGNHGKYHPLVRPALLTSALGYTIAGIGITLDIGRPGVVWKVPLFFWHWNLNSVLLEVALCVMAYIAVTWIELSPMFLEQFETSSVAPLRKGVRFLRRFVERGLIWIIALGILLPTMHQSSLGTLMMLAGPRLHPLWHTPLLPLLFLTSCIGMGFAVVVFESSLANRFFHRDPEVDLLAGVARAILPVQAIFVLLRVADLLWQGKAGLVLRPDIYSVMFLVEMGLFVAPVFMLRAAAARRDLAALFRAAMVLMLAGSLYRFDTYLLAFQPGSQWSYFPSVTEVLITVGLVAGEILAYIVIVKLFPVLAAGRRPQLSPVAT